MQPVNNYALRDICARVCGGSMAHYEHVAGQYTRTAREGAKAAHGGLLVKKDCGRNQPQG